MLFDEVVVAYWKYCLGICLRNWGKPLTFYRYSRRFGRNSNWDKWRTLLPHWPALFLQWTERPIMQVWNLIIMHWNCDIATRRHWSFRRWTLVVTSDSLYSWSAGGNCEACILHYFCLGSFNLRVIDTVRWRREHVRISPIEHIPFSN
jgi:hypothetical protein